MKRKQILMVVEMYEKRLLQLGVRPREFPHHLKPETREEHLSHLLSMCPQMRDFIKEKKKRGKVFRWLGFTQGVLWCEKEYPMTQLRAHNRSS